MTYVDEFYDFKLFSNPKHRIFPQTKSLIGRKVQNGHSHESVHIVNQTVEALQKREKDEASFLLKIGEKFILIKYFVVRDEKKISTEECSKDRKKYLIHRNLQAKDVYSIGKISHILQKSIV